MPSMTPRFARRLQPSKLKDWVREKLPLASELTRVRPAQYLGGGSYGQAFLSDDGGTVLKLTVDKSEAVSVALVKEMRARGDRLPGLVGMQGMPKRLGPVEDEGFGTYTAWAILKEPVRELSDSELDRFPDVPRSSLPLFREVRPAPGVKGPRVQTAWHHATEAGIAWKKARSVALKSALKREYIEWLKIARRPARTRHIADTLIRLAQKDVFIVDAIPHNFGRNSRGEVVAFDFGVVPFDVAI